MRKYIIGAVFGIVLTVSTSVLAEEIQSLIGRPIEGQFPVTLNDKPLEKNAIVVDGSSYLPVRAVGEALNLDVGFDADLGISLKAKPVPSPTPMAGSATNVPTIDKEKELYAVNAEILEWKGQIQAANLLMAATEHDLQTADSAQKTLLLQKIDKYKASIADSQAKIAELEAKKAALEAQK